MSNFIGAVIFDWAGTVVDYGCIAPVAGLHDAFAAQGVTVPLEVIRRDMGIAKRGHIEKLLALPSVATAFETANGHPADASDADAIFKAFETLLRERLTEYARPLEGVVEMVEELRADGIRVGSTTGYSRSLMETVIPIAAEWGYRPECVMTPGDVPMGRPAPWMCLENAKHLGVYPMSRIVKVGDTLVDIDEGRNAGMWTVGVVEGSSLLGLSQEEVAELSANALDSIKDQVMERYARHGADCVIDRIGDLPQALVTIEKRLARGGRPGGAL